MSGKRDVIYRYDGSLAGFLCCVDESALRGEAPLHIREWEAGQESLYPQHPVETDPARARRVWKQLEVILGARGRFLVERGFLHGGADKDDALLEFIRLGRRVGTQAAGMLTHPAVEKVSKLAQQVSGEANRYLEFLRFQEHRGVLAAEIEPRHRVLPVLKGHFCSRFGEERFLIYDRVHRDALVYRPHQARIVRVDGFEMPRESRRELIFERLWTRYYDTIGIQERENPECRRGHMPKRFWALTPELGAGQAVLEARLLERLRDGEDGCWGLLADLDGEK